MDSYDTMIKQLASLWLGDMIFQFGMHVLFSVISLVLIEVYLDDTHVFGTQYIYILYTKRAKNTCLYTCMYVLNRYMYVLPFTRLGHLFFLQSFPVVLTLIHVGSITSVDWYRGSSNVQETQRPSRSRLGRRFPCCQKDGTKCTYLQEVTGEFKWI